MQPTDPKLNIVIGAKLAATTNDLQNQLNELTKGLEAKVSTISFDDKSLQVLNEFVSSFRELTTLLEQNQKMMTSTSDSASKLGTSLVDAARQAQQQFEGVNAQLSGTLQKIIQLQDQAGKVFQRTFVVSERYGQQAKQTLTYNDDGSFKASPIQVTVDSASEEKAKAEIERWAQQMHATINNAFQTGKINDSQFSQMSASVAKVTEQLQAGKVIMNDWRDQIQSVNTQWKVMNDNIKANDQLLKQAESFRYQQDSLQNRLDNVKQLPFVNKQITDQLQFGINSLTENSPTTDVKRLTDVFDAIEQANRKLEADLKATQTEEAKTAQQMAQEVIKAEQDKIQAFKEELTQIKLNNQLEIDDNTTSFNKARELILQHTQLLQQNVQLRKQALTDLYNYEMKQYAEEEKMNNSSDNHPLSRFKFAPTEVLKATAWYGMYDAMHSVASGFVDIQNAAAGLQQVFGQYMQGQQGVNDVTNQFIGIAQQYGVSISDVMDAAKLWGRQYKDLETAIQLTNSSTLLSVVDNLNVADANKAVESSMNAMGMSVQNAGQAYQASMKLVDSWSAVAHGASVSAADLTQGFERSAAAAHDAGITVDQLNALVAAGVRNTGRSGAVIGNMYKSIIANLTSDSPKVQEALKALNIDTQGKSTWQIMLQIADAAKTATVEQSKYFEVLSGGKYQYDTMRAALANTQTILNAYNVSLNSNGQATELAQAQMHTFGAELQRLHDAMQKGVFDSSNGGLASGLKQMVVWTTDLVVGLEKLPSAVTYTIAGIVGLLAAIKGFSSATQLVRDFRQEMQTLGKQISDAYDRYKNGVPPKAGSSARQVAQQVTNTSVETEQKVATDATTASIEKKTAALNAEAAAQERANAATQAGVAADVELEAADAAVTAAETEETAVTTGLAAVFEGLDIASGGIVLAIGAVLAVLTGLAVHVGEASQKTDELTQKIRQMNDVAANSLQNNGEQVKALVDQYKQLDQQTGHGTVGSADTLQKYYEVSQQLGSYLPQLTEYVDQNGKTHLKNAQAVEQEYQNLLKVNNLDNQGVLKNTAENYDKLLKNASDYNDQMKKLEQQVDSLDYNPDGSATEVKQVGKFTEIISLSAAQVQDLKDQIKDLGDKSHATFEQMAQDAINAAKAKAQIDTKTSIGDQTAGFASEIQSALDFSKITSDTQREKVIIDIASVIETVNKAEQDGKLNTDVFNQALDKLASDGVPLLTDKVNNLKQSYNDATQAQQQWQTSLDAIQQTGDDVINKNKLLDQALQELNQTQHISGDTLVQLLEKYPKLIQETGLQTDAVKAWAEQTKRANADVLNSEKAKQEAIIESAQASITAYNAQLQALNALTEGNLQAAESAMQGALQAGQLIGGGDYDAQKKKIEQGIADAQQKIQDAQNAIAALNAYTADAIDTTSKATNQQDAYQTALDNVTTAIDAQKAALQGMNDTSQAYRDGLQKEIDLLQKKADLLKQDINSGGGTPANVATGGGGSSSSGASYSGAMDYKAAAQAAAQKLGWNWQVILAQWILETGDFTSGVFKADNNPAGIKWYPGMPNASRGEPASDGGYYAHFDSPQALAQSYAQFAENNGYGWRVRAAGQDPYAEAAALKAHGWATDPSYVSKIMSIVNNLGAYSTTGSGGGYGGGGVYKVGSTGQVVREIQQKVGATVDGIFGAATKAAVERWQKAHGLTADGIVGQQTLAKMGLGGSGSSSGSSSGSNGSDPSKNIAQLQQELIQTQQEIQQLNDQIVESQLKSFDSIINDKNANVIQRWQDISKQYADGSNAQIQALKDVAYWQNGTEYQYEQEMKYIEQEMKSTKISAAEKEKLSQTYEKIDTDLQKIRSDEADTYFQIVTNQIKEQDKAVQDLDKKLQNVQKTLQDYPSTSKEYQDAYAQQIVLIQQKAAALIAEQNLINQQIASNTHLTAAQKDQLEQNSQQIVDQYGQLQDQIVQMKKDAANQIVQAEKDAISQQMKLMDEAHQNALKQLQDEKNAYDKLIDAKIKALQQNQSNQDYQEQLQKDQQDLQKLQNQYNALAMDNSEAGLAQKAQLAQQIADQQQKIADEQRKHQADLIQQNLQDQKQAYDDSIQAQTDAENEKYDKAKQTLQNILDDTEYWNKQITQIMEGNTKEVQQQLQDLIKEVGDSYNSVTTSTENQASAVSSAMEDLAGKIQDTMNTTGDSIQQNLIDQLGAALKIMQQLGNIKLPTMPSTQPTNGAPTYDISTGKTVGSMKIGGTTYSGTYSGSTFITSGKTPSQKDLQGKDVVRGLDGKLYIAPTHEQAVNAAGGQWINGHWYAGKYVNGVFETSDKKTPALGKGMYEVRSDKGMLYIGSSQEAVVNAAGGQWIHGKWVKGKYVNHKWEPAKLDTGGYTGEDVPESGALAILHKKELILNAKDTQNILDAVKMIRQMGINFTGSNNLLAQAIQGITKAVVPSVDTGGGNNPQTVTIHMPITIGTLQGGEKGAEDLFTTINQQLKRKGVILR